MQPFTLVVSELETFDLPLNPAADFGYASGQVLADRYELTRVIGRGGTAIVWVARDSVLAIEVAVKIVLPSRSDLSAELRDRTVQEARLCAQLTDPAVCRVLDFGFTPRGDPFVVSELLSGETLDDRLAREHRLPPVEAVRLLLPILDALGAAHKKGIVHRDVKPANVFLARSDGRIQPKLLDFGIACSPDVRSRMTADGGICGTPCYMSPEQARGSSDIDHRSDLWSFCVTLYETVSGNAPFLNDNCNATLFAIASQTAPSLASFRCDATLARIVQRGMEKQRHARWRSAAELANALAHWLVDRGLESDAYGLSLRRRFLEQSAAPVPVLLDVAHDLTTERAVSFVPRRRQKWAGAIALASTFTAVAVLSAVVVSAGRSLPARVTQSKPAVAAPAVRPPPGPPLPVSEDVRTEAVVAAPARREPAPAAGVAPRPAASGGRVSPPRPRATLRQPESLDLPPLPSFPPPSPFSSPSARRAHTEPAPAPPAKPRGRARSVPRRDFGI